MYSVTKIQTADLVHSVKMASVSLCYALVRIETVSRVPVLECVILTLMNA